MLQARMAIATNVIKLHRVWRFTLGSGVRGISFIASKLANGLSGLFSANAAGSRIERRDRAVKPPRVLRYSLFI
jgi:hypothetical protein